MRHKLAELAVSAEAGAALTYHALRRFLDGGDAVREVTMAKLLTQRANFELQDACYGCSPTSATPARTTSRAPPATRASARSAAAPTRS